MKLYNTLTRSVEQFKPQTDNTVSLYTCGPTVYNYYHIGNLRNAVFNDTLRRTLEQSGFAVRHVMNITDVGHLTSDADEGEDKLEKGAQREGKSVWDIAAHYTEAFKADMAAMHVLPPNGYTSEKYHDTYARATEFIDQQIAMVQLLLDKGYAYIAEKAIYFDVTKLPDYGILSGQRLADKERAVRDEVVTDSDKKNPFDFSIWFFAVGRYAGHTMRWDNPPSWGKGEGFPGWHLECSAIIHATLGDPIDIHTGGIDHIGTHHANEMAQTEAAFGHELAKYWVHNDFMLVDGAKMSKSLGNSYTLQDITGKGFSALDYRMFCLQAHYRSELNFSWDNLEAARNRLQSLRDFADLQFQPSPEARQITGEYFVTMKEKVQRALEHDLGTPEALRILSEVIDEAGAGKPHPRDVPEIEAFLLYLDAVFGLDLAARDDIQPEQKEMIEDRQDAKERKDWAIADEIRDKLKAQGVGLRDTPHGAVWYRLA